MASAANPIPPNSTTYVVQRWHMEFEWARESAVWKLLRDGNGHDWKSSMMHSIVTECVAKFKIAANKVLRPLPRAEGGFCILPTKNGENEIKQLRFCRNAVIRLAPSQQGEKDGDRLHDTWTLEQLLDLMDTFAEVVNSRLEDEKDPTWLSSFGKKRIRAQLIFD